MGKKCKEIAMYTKSLKNSPIYSLSTNHILLLKWEGSVFPLAVGESLSSFSSFCLLSVSSL